MVRTATPKDRGWSWVILAVTFVNIGLVSFMYIVGIFYVVFLETFGGTRSTVAWIGSTQAGLCCLTGRPNTVRWDNRSEKQAFIQPSSLIRAKSTHAVVSDFTLTLLTHRMLASVNRLQQLHGPVRSVDGLSLRLLFSTGSRSFTHQREPLLISIHCYDHIYVTATTVPTTTTAIKTT